MSDYFIVWLKVCICAIIVAVILPVIEFISCFLDERAIKKLKKEVERKRDASNLKYIIYNKYLYIIDEEEYDHYHMYNMSLNMESALVYKEDIKAIEGDIGIVDPSNISENEIKQLLFDNLL